MMIDNKWLSLCITCVALTTNALAAPITAVNYDTLTLGATIVGPVGPEVETSLTNTDGNSIGDLASNVSCPESFSECVPADNPSQTIYTYVHTVIPGVDSPNDDPFPNPPTVLDFDNVLQFRLNFTAYGFNGVAGYSFADADAANVMFDVNIDDAGQIVWETTSSNWDTGESMTFFWQTTQSPSGPGGEYNISNADDNGQGAGPLPSVPINVTEPFAAIMFLLMGLALYKRDPYSHEPE